MIMRAIHLTAIALVLLMTFSASAATKKSGSVPPGKIVDPQIAAQRLYTAWKKHDRKRAKAVAANDAVSKLFSAKFRDLEFQGCDHGDEGFQCVYHDAKEGLFDVAFTVEGGASAGYGVTAVSFSSEE